MTERGLSKDKEKMSLNRREFLGTAALATSIGVARSIGSGLPTRCSPHNIVMPENLPPQRTLAYIGTQLRS